MLLFAQVLNLVKKNVSEHYRSQEMCTRKHVNKHS